MSVFVLSQILIGISFLFDLASFQFKKRNYTLVCFVCAASLISAHYFLLKQPVAGFIIALSATRFLVSIFSKDVRFKYLFLVLVTVTGLWNYEKIIDLLPLAAGYVATFAVFQPDDRLLRRLMMTATVCIITFNIFIFTPVGIFTESFFLASNLLAYWRFYIKQKVS